MSSEGEVGHPSRDRPTLPYAKAFVVHFSTETDARLEHVTGRVEHLQTGRRVAFASVVELLDSIVALLAEDRPEPTTSEGPRPRGNRGPRSKPAPGASAEPALP